MADHPVDDVSWYGAAAYCNWLSEIQGLESCYDTTTWAHDFSKNGYHLPTEAQWERAAGWDPNGTGEPDGPGRHYRYGNGSDSISCATVNYAPDNPTVYCNPMGFSVPPYTSPVGYYNGTNGTINSPSPAGCYDMSGNMKEWVHDRWLRLFTSEPLTDPEGPGSDPEGPFSELFSGTNRMNRGGGYYSSPSGSLQTGDRGGNHDPDGMICGFRVARNP